MKPPKGPGISKFDLWPLFNFLGNKPNIHERDWSKFDRENFILDYFSVDWEDLLKIDELNAENSTKMYLDQCPGTQIHFFEIFSKFKE